MSLQMPDYNTFIEALKPTIDMTQVLAANSVFREIDLRTGTFIQSYLEMANEAAESIKKAIGANRLDISRFTLISELETPLSPLPYIPPRQQQREDGASVFLIAVQRKIWEAEEQAQREGGKVEVLCTTPSGNIMELFHLSCASPYFIRIVGIDREGQRHDYEVDYHRHGVSIEVVELSGGDFEDEGNGSSSIN